MEQTGPSMNHQAPGPSGDICRAPAHWAVCSHRGNRAGARRSLTDTIQVKQKGECLTLRTSIAISRPGPGGVSLHADAGLSASVDVTPRLSRRL